jgi:hypothetical protein
MSEQPEALRLAQRLAHVCKYSDSEHWDDLDAAAAELRRLHAENVLLHERHHFDNGVLCELLQALKDATDAIEHWGTYATDYFQKKWDLQSDINAARAAIARAEGQV